MLERGELYLFTSERTTAMHKRLSSIQVQLGEPVTFIGVTYRNIGDGLLIGTQFLKIATSWESPQKHGGQLLKAESLELPNIVGLVRVSSSQETVMQLWEWLCES